MKMCYHAFYIPSASLSHTMTSHREFDAVCSAIVGELDAILPHSERPPKPNLVAVHRNFVEEPIDFKSSNDGDHGLHTLVFHVLVGLATDSFVAAFVVDCATFTGLRRFNVDRLSRHVDKGITGFIEQGLTERHVDADIIRHLVDIIKHDGGHTPNADTNGLYNAVISTIRAIASLNTRSLASSDANRLLPILVDTIVSGISDHGNPEPLQPELVFDRVHFLVRVGMFLYWPDQIARNLYMSHGYRARVRRVAISIDGPSKSNQDRSDIAAFLDRNTQVCFVVPEPSSGIRNLGITLQYRIFNACRQLKSHQVEWSLIESLPWIFHVRVEHANMPIPPPPPPPPVYHIPTRYIVMGPTAVNGYYGVYNLRAVCVRGPSGYESRARAIHPAGAITTTDGDDEDEEDDEDDGDDDGDDDDVDDDGDDADSIKEGGSSERQPDGVGLAIIDQALNRPDHDIVSLVEGFLGQVQASFASDSTMHHHDDGNDDESGVLTDSYKRKQWMTVTERNGVTRVETTLGHPTVEKTKWNNKEWDTYVLTVKQDEQVVFAAFNRTAAATEIDYGCYDDDDDEDDDDGDDDDKGMESGDDGDGDDASGVSWFSQPGIHPDRDTSEQTEHQLFQIYRTSYESSIPDDPLRSQLDSYRTLISMIDKAIKTKQFDQRWIESARVMKVVGSREEISDREVDKMLLDPGTVRAHEDLLASLSNEMTEIESIENYIKTIDVEALIFTPDQPPAFRANDLSDLWLRYSSYGDVTNASMLKNERDLWLYQSKLPGKGLDPYIRIDPKLTEVLLRAYHRFVVIGPTSPSGQPVEREARRYLLHEMRRSMQYAVNKFRSDWTQFLHKPTTRSSGKATSEIASDMDLVRLTQQIEQNKRGVHRQRPVKVIVPTLVLPDATQP